MMLWQSLFSGLSYVVPGIIKQITHESVPGRLSSSDNALYNLSQTNSLGSFEDLHKQRQTRYQSFDTYFFIGFVGRSFLAS